MDKPLAIVKLHWGEEKVPRCCGARNGDLDLRQPLRGADEEQDSRALQRETDVPVEDEAVPRGLHWCVVGRGPS